MDRNFYYSDKDADWVRSLSARRAWIEMSMGLDGRFKLWSLSARRAWIEIFFCRYPARCVVVALRKESVDRNCWLVCLAPGCLVALRKESVDRNFDIRRTTSPCPRSLSARRAWIEIWGLSYCRRM